RRLHERAPQQAVRADAVPQPDRGGADPADEAHQDRHPRQPAGAARPPRAAGRGDRDARLHVGRADHLGVRPRRAAGVPGPEHSAGRGARPAQRGVGSDHQGLDDARAVCVAWQVLELRPRLDLAPTPTAAAPAHRPPRPARPPPPTVLRANGDEGPATAARRRVPPGAAYRSTERSRLIFDKYRAAAARHGWTPTAEHCHVLRHVYVAETDARARAEAQPHLDYFWQSLLSYHRGSMKLFGQSSTPRPAVGPAPEGVPFYVFEFGFTPQQGLTFVGAPDTVTREIKAHMKELGAGVIMGLFQFGSMPHDLAKRNIELFARTVLPELKRE